LALLAYFSDNKKNICNQNSSCCILTLLFGHFPKRTLYRDRHFGFSIYAYIGLAIVEEAMSCLYYSICPLAYIVSQSKKD